MTTAFNAAPSLNPVEPSNTDDALLRAARRLASIHDGIKGQRIPPETMAFYQAVVRRDAYRPRMLRVVVPESV